MGEAMVWTLVVLAGARPVVDGGLPRGQVEDVIAWHSSEVNTCLSGAGRGAQLHYRFGIQPDGRVGLLRFVDSRALEPTQATCIATALERWPFPGADAGTLVDWTFQATPFDAGVPERPTFALSEFPEAWASDLRECQEQSDPTVSGQGRLTLELAVSPSGSVVDASIISSSSGLEIPSLRACITAAALHWSGPRDRAWRRLRTDWVLAWSEEKASELLDAGVQARVVRPTPRPTEDNPEGGGLERAVIAAEILRAKPMIVHCYEATIQERGELTGIFVVAFTIDAAGRVKKQAAARDTLGDEGLSRCILGVVSRFQFPPPLGGGDVTVTFPWIFMTTDAARQNYGIADAGY